jgi:Uma2 family endonuclease
MAWAGEDTHAEWVDGEVVLMSPVNLEHQDLVGFLYALVLTYVQSRDLGRVFLAGVLMRLAMRPSGREPDLLFVSNAHADRLRPTYLDGPADLVVEIVSPDSDDRDRREKLLEYETAAIPEYWLIDPQRQEALIFQLAADGRYRRTEPDAEGRYQSTILPGFWLRIDWLWQRPLPRVAALAEQIEQSGRKAALAPRSASCPDRRAHLVRRDR